MDELEVRWLMTREGPDIDTLLDELVNRPAWHRRAACRGSSVDLFVIDQGSQYEDGTREFCAGCLVRQECLATALANGGSTTGLWGGTTPSERRQMRRGRAVA
jgi:WhiB family redox-sensing transcriptional regulator